MMKRLVPTLVLLVLAIVSFWGATLVSSSAVTARWYDGSVVDCATLRLDTASIPVGSTPPPNPCTAAENRRRVRVHELSLAGATALMLAGVWVIIVVISGQGSEPAWTLADRH